MGSKEDVYCTLLMSDSYLPGAVVLAHSLRDNGTLKKLAVLVTLDSLLYDTLSELRGLFDYVIPVDKLANPDLDNLSRIDRLDLRFAFTKIALWQQEQFRKIVYIDADVVALKAPDELFDVDAAFAAAPDIGWPDCFNTGVMVLSPNIGDYRAMQTLAASGTSFDGGDQGLLNQYFEGRPWQRLSYTYNCTPNASYQYEPAYRHFRSSIKVTHFLGKEKPWQKGREAMSNAGSAVYKELLGSWWAVYDRHYKAQQSPALSQAKADEHVQRYVKGQQAQSAAAPAAGDSSEALKNLVGPARPLSPPVNTWDATRAEPPSQSKPEAGSFTDQRYNMSRDPDLVQPQQKYYRVTTGPEAQKPKPLFPWEQSAKKATRTFANEGKPSATKPSSSEGAASQGMPSSFDPPVSPSPIESLTRTNIWDNVTSIDEYVRAMKQSQAKRGKVQVLHNFDEKDFAANPPSTARRRESMILTDFPTDVERPSLPVTPAPRRPLTFWGEERDEEGNLPAAEGVPDQADWDPNEKLEQLRQNSLMATEQLPTPQTKDLPARDLPESSAPLPNSPSGSGPRVSPPPPAQGRKVATGLSRAAPEAAASVEADMSSLSQANEVPGEAMRKELEPNDELSV